MRIGFFSDLHGNLPALEACLADMSKQGVDLVVCGGDLVNPLWTSAEAVDRVFAMGLPYVRGNHEDYVWRVALGEADEATMTSPRWLPVLRSAERIGRERAARLRALPLHHRLEAAPGRARSSIFLCHASPERNARTPIVGIDEDLENDLEATNASAVVFGHWHLAWTASRALADGRPQLLVASGSAGLPMRGSAHAEYAILTYRQESGFEGWTAEARTIPYDREAALREFRESGALDAGGPIAWCLYDELASAEKRLGVLFPWLRETGQDPQTLHEWRQTVRDFLEARGRWSFIRSQLQDGGGR